MEAERLAQALSELLTVTRELQRLIVSIDPQRTYQALLKLRDIYLTLGGDWRIRTSDPFSFWVDLIQFETYLSPQDRESLRPFKHLVEYALSGFSRHIQDQIAQILASLIPGPEPRPY